MRAEFCVSFHVKCLILLCDFNQIWSVWINFSTASKRVFSWRFSDCYFRTDRRAHGHDEANRRVFVKASKWSHMTWLKQRSQTVSFMCGFAYPGRQNSRISAPVRFIQKTSPTLRNYPLCSRFCCRARCKETRRFHKSSSLLATQQFLSHRFPQNILPDLS
jgi:hypothetical protein